MDDALLNQKQSLLDCLRKGYFSHVRRLLEANLCNPNETSKIELNAKTSNSIIRISTLQYPVGNRTPLMYCSLIEDNVWSYSLAQMLIEKGAILSLKDSNGLNALMYACLYQKIKLVELFLNAMGDFNLLECDTLGNTALHVASLGKNQEICCLLNEKCFKYNMNNASFNKAGLTPLRICQHNGHEKCISLVNTRTNKNDLVSPHVYMLNSNMQQSFQQMFQNDPMDSSLAPLYEPYRVVYLSKEHLIRKSCLNQKSLNTTTTIAKDLLKKRSKTAQVQVIQNEETHLTNRSIENSPKKVSKLKDSRVRIDSSEVVGSGWRSNVNHIFDAYEWKISESYRHSCSYVPTALDQLGFMKQLMYSSNTSNNRKSMAPSQMSRMYPKMTINMSRRQSNMSFIQN